MGHEAEQIDRELIPAADEVAERLLALGPREDQAPIDEAEFGEGGFGALGLEAEHAVDHGGELRRGHEPTKVAAHAPGGGLPADLAARGVIEAHGGRLWLESKPDQGARFVLTLPAGAGR